MIEIIYKMSYLIRGWFIVLDSIRLLLGEVERYGVGVVVENFVF